MIVEEGTTCGHGAFVLDRQHSGDRVQSVWHGRAVATGRSVIVTHRRFYLGEQLEHWLRASTPGVAPLLFLGQADGDERTFSRKEPRDIVFVEARPDGTLLVDAEPLPYEGVVRLGVGLCDVVRAAPADAALVESLAPVNVYVHGTSSRAQLAGVAPRALLVVGQEGYSHKRESYDYEAPHGSPTDPSRPSMTYISALLLWFASERVHPFAVDGDSVHNNMWNDVRRPFSGPPELGRLLEAVLVCDPQKRMTVEVFHDELLALARKWNVEVPPFPPPGLEP